MAGRLLPWLRRVGSCQIRALRVQVAGQVRGYPGLPRIASNPGLCPLSQSLPSVLSPLCQESNFPRSLHVSAGIYSKKGKDKGGKSKKDRGKLIKPTDEELSEVFDVQKLHKEMQNVVERLGHDYLTQLALHFSVGTFEDRMVPTPDGQFRLDQLGQVIQKATDRIQIDMTPSPQYVSHVREAVAKMGRDLRIQQDGTSLFIQVPIVTKEYRESLVKSAKTFCDKYKDNLRDIYKKYHKKIDNVKSLHSEDLIRTCQANILDILHMSQDQMDEMMRAKQKDLLNAK